MYDGLEADGRLEEFHLSSELRKNHRYLSDNVNNSQTHIDKFQQLKAGFKVLGFQEAEVDAVYSVLAAILHLGDIEFNEILSEDNTDNKSAVVDNEPVLRGNFHFILGILKVGRILQRTVKKLDSSKIIGFQS